MAGDRVTKLATDTAAQARTAMEQGGEQARKMLEEGAAQAKAAMEQGSAQAAKATESLLKAAEEAVEFNRGTFEIYTRATQTYVVGVQDLGRQSFALMQGLTDHALEGAKALAAVKSLKEAADIQAAYGKAAIEKAMSETAKIEGAAVKLVEETIAPLAARARAAVEKMAKPIAA